jgi:hypothetical protein
VNESHRGGHITTGITKHTKSHEEARNIHSLDFSSGDRIGKSQQESFRALRRFRDLRVPQW